MCIAAVASGKDETIKKKLIEKQDAIHEMARALKS